MAPPDEHVRAWRWAGLVTAVLCLVGLWFAPTHDLPGARHAVAVAAFMIVLWITEAVSHALAGCIGLALFLVLGVAGPRAVLSGFRSETTWFLLAAMAIGAMASQTGLAMRLARAAIAAAGTTYARLLLGFILTDFALTFLVPSGIARVTILASIAFGVIEAFGVGPRSNVGRGLLLIITYTAGIFDKMVIAGATSILARGIITDVGKVPVLYSHWFLAYLPCDVITILVCWRLVLRLFPPEKTAMDGAAWAARLGPSPPWSVAEKKCAVYMGLAMVLWLTDFIHHTDPAWVGIGVAVLALLPGVGVLKAKDLRRLNYGAIVFTAAALSMSRVLSETRGLEVLTSALFGWIAPLLHGPVLAAVVLYWTAFVYHFFLASETAMLGTSLPVVLSLAQAHGLDMLTAGRIWTFAAGGKIFVYQSGVLLVGYSYGYFGTRDLLKIGAILTLVEFAILILLVSVYWPLLGI
jgi:anion transporter